MAIAYRHWGLLALAAITGSALGWVGRVDYEWTLILYDHRSAGILDFMGRTVFEGEAFGGGDPVILYLLLMVGIYYLGWKDRLPARFLAWRPAAGFVLASTLIGSLGLVHALKWAVGRARPHLVVFADWPFTQWHEWGPHFVTDGIYRGSFPSGHTAQAAVFMTLAYVLSGNPDNSGTHRIGGWILGTAAAGYAAFMGIARCMSLSHWVSDVAAGFFFPWIVMHILYFMVFRVPLQARHSLVHGRLPKGPAAWELRLSFHLLLTLAGITLFFLGVRAMMRDLPALAATLIPAGIGVGLVFSFLAVRLHGSALSGFRKPTPGD